MHRLPFPLFLNIFNLDETEKNNAKESRTHVSNMTNTGASPFVSRCTWYRSVPGSCSLTAAAAVVRSSWTCENLLDGDVCGKGE
jgi:hypothetical protein